MDFNKCSRCGCFFSHSGTICPNCVSKESTELNKLENYLEDSNTPVSIEELSYNTGISAKNLQKHIQMNNQFSKYKGITNLL